MKKWEGSRRKQDRRERERGTGGMREGKKNEYRAVLL